MSKVSPRIPFSLVRRDEIATNERNRAVSDVSAYRIRRDGKRLAVVNSGTLSTANHKFDPSSPDDGRWTMDDAPPSIVYRPSSKAGTHLRFDALSYLDTRVQPGTTYNYTVEAIDILGQTSAPSHPTRPGASWAAAPSAAKSIFFARAPDQSISAAAVLAAYSAALRRATRISTSATTLVPPD